MLAPPPQLQRAVISVANGPGCRSALSALRRNCFTILIAVIFALAAAPASADQIGGVVSIYNDDRYRGVSVSDRRPVGTLDLSYDASTGLYASASGAIVDTRDEGFRLLSVSFSGGYAWKIRPGFSADLGVSHFRFSHYSGLSSGRGFTEIYAGLAGRILGGRISFSPNYLGLARWTAYGELEGHWDLSPNTAVESGAGVLVPLGRKAYQERLRPQADAHVGLAQRVGRLTLHAAISGRSGRNSDYGVHDRKRVALVIGLSTAL